MKLTRRRLTKLAVTATAAPLVPTKRITAQPSPKASATNLDLARLEIRSAAQALATVKLPRTTEPAVRFEA